MKTTMIMTCALAAMLAFPALAEEQSGVVSAGVLNVRLKPELNSPAVAKLKSGEKVTILQKCGNFYELSAVNLDVPVYVSAVYITNNQTFAPLSMRSEMSSKAPSYGILPSGSKVEVKSVSGSGWAKLLPPDIVKVYAAAAYIRADAAVPPVKTEAGKKIEEKSVPVEAGGAVKPAEKSSADQAVVSKVAAVKAEEKKAVVKTEKKAEEKKAVVKTEKKALTETYAKALKDLNVEIAKNKKVEESGVVVEVPKTNNPAISYALMKQGKKGYDTVYFLFSDNAAVSLKKVVNCSVKLSGDAYAVPGWKNAVVRVEKLVVTE